MGSGHLPPWRSRRFTQGLNSDFHERPPGGARGAPLAASEAFGVGERGAAGTRRGPPDTAEAPPFFRLLPGRVSMEPPDGLPRPLWSSGTGFPRTKVRTPRPLPHRGQAQTPAAGNQSQRLSGPPPTPRPPCSLNSSPMKPNPDLFQESLPGGAAKPGANADPVRYEPVLQSGVGEG